jgi:dTDP-4-dehydrorhamnose reductase
MTTTPTAIVFGARGTLGVALSRALPAAGYRLGAAPSHAECDITDAAAVRALVAAVRPQVVFNAAAYTDVDRAELEPELALRINADGAEVVAQAAAAHGAAMVHYSTDFVFDGEQEGPYRESDPPSPQGAYARTKAEGDSRVAAAAPRHFILRVGCLYGHGGRNVPSTIVRRLRAGETIRADGERVASPTWVRDVAAASISLVETTHYGLYHATSQGETSWADFARHAAALLELRAARVEGVPSAALRLKAPRPRRAILDNSALRARGLDTFPTWQEALRAFINEDNDHKTDGKVT